MFHVKRCPSHLYQGQVRRFEHSEVFSDSFQQLARIGRGILQYNSMLDRDTVRKLLGPFDLTLSDGNIDRLLEYLGLLLRWNQKINLTAIRSPHECVTRHFGESLFLSHVVAVHGNLLDIGSGAGFPGLALKLLFPELKVTLLEPVTRKRAFLKEVARSCSISSVRVLGRRIREFSDEATPHSFDLVTVRAVGGLESVVPKATRLLRHGGYICLWVGTQQLAQIQAANPDLQWQLPVSIPLSLERCILAGRLEGDHS